MGYQDDFYAHPRALSQFGEEPPPSLALFARKAAMFAAHFARFLPESRDACILDAGCGSGSLVWWLQSRGYARAAGVDISEENAKLAASLGIANVRQGDLRESLRAARETYDAIVMRDVLEHFAKEQVIELLDAARAALKVGGRLILQVPNGESPLSGRIRYGDFTHELAFTASSLAQLFDRTGFRVHAFAPSRPVGAGFRSTLRALLWYPVEWMLRSVIWIESGPGPRIVTQNLIAVAVRS